MVQIGAVCRYNQFLESKLFTTDNLTFFSLATIKLLVVPAHIKINSVTETGGKPLKDTNQFILYFPDVLISSSLVSHKSLEDPHADWLS